MDQMHPAASPEGLLESAHTLYDCHTKKKMPFGMNAGLDASTLQQRVQKFSSLASRMDKVLVLVLQLPLDFVLATPFAVVFALALATAFATGFATALFFSVAPEVYLLLFARGVF